MAFHPEQQLGYLINRAGSMMRTYLRRRFVAEGYDVGVEHWSILVNLWLEDGLSQNELVGRIMRDKSSITRVLDSMEKDNVLVRVPDRDDKRSKRVHLTQKGRQLRAALQPIVEATQRDALSGIPDAELESCRRVMRHIYDNLNDELR